MSVKTIQYDVKWYEDLQSSGENMGCFNDILSRLLLITSRQIPSASNGLCLAGIPVDIVRDLLLVTHQPRLNLKTPKDLGIAE